ncbi:alpha/beta hydrolase [Aquimarina sp. U1-2]|uniref:alpha/beta fold hydrolase n=1 Tax=Aquimarina sp. U1-2 TaxID=2823141 RepID=UPI001AEC8E2F|nr:alpha/beta hydrolase [Aquimarina sp. U1-2]MBP2832912.1 alpha/beta hydrolase [Aquimarina sp. U1-2]
MIQVVETNLGKIEYKKVGKGQPILFLHGGHADCNMPIAGFGIDLNKYNLIIPSRPGYGNTPLSTYKKPEQAAELLSSLLEFLMIKSVIVIGISAGGLTAIAFAAIKFESVKRLLLISAITKRWMQKDNPKYRIARVFFYPKIEVVTWWIVRLTAKLFPKTLAHSFFKEFSLLKHQKLTKFEIKALRDMLCLQRSKQGFINDIDQHLRAKILTQVKIPTLIFHSVHDASVDVEMAMHAKYHIKDCQLFLFENKWGHLLWIGRDTNSFRDTLNTHLLESAR